MADQYEWEATAIAAAKIVCSLRSRRLVRWPDWLPRPSMEEPEEETVAPPPPPLPVMWPKRQRANGRSKAANAWPVSLKNLFGDMAPSASCGDKDGPTKRKLDNDGEECRSPAKQVRVDGDRAAATSAEDKVEETKKIRSDDNRDEKGCLLFDLNEDAPCEEN
ncbi:unnamed protein product [Alopecurus aequalis]